MNFLLKIKIHLNQKINLYVLLGLILISLGFGIYYYERGQLLLYGDALSRLNIARKTFDNLTPGLAQLGNVWLPLPQLLMMPLVASNYLWHSGIAGAIISMTSYVLGGFFLFKTLMMINNSKIGNLIALSVYALNINVLYLQTTAMSESIFLCTLILAIYNFAFWIKTKNRLNLIPAAIAVSCMTLIRYEGLAILLSSILMVFVFTLIATKNYHKAEGSTVFYSTLACLGFALWSLYLAVIFGDPLYWKNYYIGTHVVGDSNTQLHVFTFHISFLEAVWKYFTAVVWMNGLFPTLLAIISLPILIVKSIKKKSYYFLPVLISFSMFLFMVLTLKRNTPIDQPALTIGNILSPDTNMFREFNIRYGLLMLPAISLMISYLFSVKSRVIKFLMLIPILVQFYSYLYPSYTVIYQIPRSVGDNITQGTPKERRAVEWMKQNYKAGLIMISALKHDPQMLELGIDYKNYIHEGTGQYWKESIYEPAKYASWIVFDSFNKDDQVTKYVGNNPSLAKNFDLLYSDDGMLIYKIKPKTDQ